MTSLDGINGSSIQTLLRGENDSKQSDEFQARIMEGIFLGWKSSTPEFLFLGGGGGLRVVEKFSKYFLGWFDLNRDFLVI